MIGNDYTVPVKLVGLEVEARLSACNVKIFSQGKIVTEHPRLEGNHQVSAMLEHYLPVFKYKHGALKGSLALAQARQTKKWPSVFDDYWRMLKRKYGESDGTRYFIEVLQYVYEHGLASLQNAINQSLACGSVSVDSIKLILRQQATKPETIEPIKNIKHLEKYDRPKSDLKIYDNLLSRRIH